MSFYQINNRPELKAFRRELRNNATKAEVVLWQYLKGKQCGGYKIRRQFSVGPYILDFYCHSRKLAIELDGGYHFAAEQQAYDKRRTDFLNSQGITVIRFLNPEVFNDTAEVLATILKHLESSNP